MRITGPSSRLNMLKVSGEKVHAHFFVFRISYFESSINLYICLRIQFYQFTQVNFQSVIVSFIYFRFCFVYVSTQNRDTFIDFIIFNG